MASIKAFLLSKFSVVTDEVLCEFLNFCSDAVEFSVLVGCGNMSMSDWHPVFQDTVVVSSSRVEMSMKTSSCFFVNILTLDDETTMISPNIRH
jgi:hypothetical protein